MTDLNFKFDVTNRDVIVGRIIIPNFVTHKYAEYDVVPLSHINYEYGGTDIKLIRVNDPDETHIVKFIKNVGTAQVLANYVDEARGELIVQVKY